MTSQLTDSERIVELEARVDALAKLVGMLTLRRTGTNLAGEGAGSADQTALWDAVARIPFGETSTYGEVSDDAGVGVAQGVGPALDKAIVQGRHIPWWRVVSADGDFATHPTQMQLELLIAEGGLTPPTTIVG